MRLVIIGLGYVGLPLAVAFAKKHDVIGYEQDDGRVSELLAGHDARGEISDADLQASEMEITSLTEDIPAADIYFITVPTPVDECHLPDLSAVREACRLVGAKMARGAIVVLESSVYPGVTEDVCGPELENASGLKKGEDFHIAHSPERVNPGDGLHSFTKVSKVVGADDRDIAEQLAQLYRGVIEAPVLVTPNIKAAEFSKILENTQRDINIALTNEAAMICRGLGISVYDVLDAADSKWNFTRFEPGLVGGHCIGVDPYYLVEIGRRHGVDPELIRAARDRNEYMAVWLGNQIFDQVVARRGNAPKAANALVLGVTFKENVPDIRNSKVILMMRQLKRRGLNVDVFDPVASWRDVKTEYDVGLLPKISDNKQYDCIIGAVAHREFVHFELDRLRALLKPGGFIFDLKNIWRHERGKGIEFLCL